MLDLDHGRRIAGTLVMALVVAHCGGGGGNDNGTDQFPVTPGTFVGTMGDGGAIQLHVGSIEGVAFDCDGQRIEETFSPPEPIDGDGSFRVSFEDAGRKFHVSGTFADANHVGGTIDDKDDRCDTTFVASHGAPPSTPTATATNRSPGTPTVTPTSDVSPTVTPTSTGPTPTSSTATPTRTPTTGGTPCPAAIEVIGNAGARKVLDTGWTGIAHNQTVIQDGKLTFTVSGCASPARPCGVCDVGGPIQNAKHDHGDINAHRCSNDTSIECESDPACTAPGKCVFFFGAPLPLAAGGISTCVMNQVNGAVSGTADIEGGTFATELTLSAQVYNGLDVALPCPVCVGDGGVNDGTKGGTCSDGPKKGQPCDVNGRSPDPRFGGTTSLDCPPNPGARIATLPIALDGSSGTETISLTAKSPNCVSSAGAGKKCFCPADGAETRPNACNDDTAIPGDGTLCMADSQTEGHCPEGPVAQFCMLDTFRGCQSNIDCPSQGDSCITGPRPCYLDNGIVGGSVKAIGMSDTPDANHEADPTFAALFCVGRTAAPAVNTAAGLPGLGRIELPLHTKQIETPP